MCGIIGALAFNGFENPNLEQIRQNAMIFFSTELIQLTETRGKDATGMATLFEDGNYIGQKMGISAKEFVTRFGDTENHFNKFVEIWRKMESRATISIGHCRKPSAGHAATPDDNKNNHPIKVGDTVGVHNGTLTNHEEIFKNLNTGRDGKVDSEAIFRLINHYTKNGEEPFSGPMLQEVCKRLSGNYACLAFNGNNPYQLAAFRDGKPMELLLIKPLKLALLASEKDFLKTVLSKYSMMAYLYGAGEIAFPILKKEDIEFETLKDDSLFIFDVRKDVTAETKISDIFHTEAVPRINKIWVAPVAAKKTTTVFYGNQAGTNPQTPAPTIPSVPVSYTQPEQKTGEGVGEKKAVGMRSEGAMTAAGTERIGMVMRGNNKTYENVFKDKVSADATHDNVVIDAETSEVIEVFPSKVLMEGKKKSDDSGKLTSGQKEETSCIQKHGLKEVSEPALINTATKAASIEVIEPTEEVKTEVLLLEAPKVVDTVDMDVDAKALELANEAFMDEPKFSNNVDLVNSLEITSENSMLSMPSYSLANRIAKFLYPKAWYNGYMAAKKEFGSPKEVSSEVTKLQEKTIKSKKLIRVLKLMVLTLAKTSANSGDEMLDESIDSVFKGKRITDINTINESFTAGDRRQAPMINTVLEKISKGKDDK